MGRRTLADNSYDTIPNWSGHMMAGLKKRMMRKEDSKLKESRSDSLYLSLLSLMICLHTHRIPKGMDDKLLLIDSNTKRTYLSKISLLLVSICWTSGIATISSFFFK
eukprot:Pompholyxophrys_sp_v1_NODE_418_length_582_cov_14.364326.p2 type:complete len:107 gc:universal NODE_418_length_582_cov_14.364326:219-539(+)